MLALKFHNLKSYLGLLLIWYCICLIFLIIIVIKRCFLGNIFSNKLIGIFTQTSLTWAGGMNKIKIGYLIFTRPVCVRQTRFRYPMWWYIHILWRGAVHESISEPKLLHSYLILIFGNQKAGFSFYNGQNSTLVIFPDNGVELPIA